MNGTLFSYFINTWKNYLGKSEYLGYSYFLTSLYERAVCSFLRSKYSFDPWHCNNTWSRRAYKRIAVNMANSINADIVIEVGCGLGDIISRIRARKRFGYDCDEAVIMAARKIRGNKVEFKVGEISDVQEEKIDLLIMVNWVHEIPPGDLEKMMSQVLSRTQFILLDHVYPGIRGYRFYHDFQFLNHGFTLRERKAGGAGEPRELLLYEAKHR